MVDDRNRRRDAVSGRGIPVGGRAEVGVHADTSNEGALPIDEADGGEQVGRGDVDRGIVGRGGGAVGKGSAHDTVVNGTGFGEQGEG